MIEFISHLLFIDEDLLFGDGSLQEIQFLNKKLTLFYKEISMVINMEKYCLLTNYLSNEVNVHLEELLPYLRQEFISGFKYLSFNLKLNSYKFVDWMWLYKKVQSKISLQANEFLSRGEILVLLKLVLDIIPIYWTSIASIPKGILTKIRKKIFSFLWLSSWYLEGIPLVKWLRVTLPKKLGGWGLKYIYLFSGGKCIMHNTSLWGRILISKYLHRLSIEEWYKHPHKLSKNGLIVQRPWCLPSP